MANVAAPDVTLSAAVANNGTVTIPYPTGYAQANFTGANASGSAYLLLNDNDRFEEADDEFDISYGASNATLTNKTGYSWPVGTKVSVAFGYAGAAAEFVQGGAVADLALTALATSNTYTDAALNAQFTAVQNKLNALLAALRTSGIIDT